jgi:hypothetical protein
MIRSACIVLFSFALLSCSKDYNPSSHLTPKEQDATMDKLIRYLAKAPEGLSMQERFYPAYNDYYEEQKSFHRLDAYYTDGDAAYFLVSRPAPSLTEKRVSTGGKVTWNEKGDLTDYEEIFRTWKMPDTVLIKKGLLLFDKMVKGESLEPYLTKNSTPEEYIEFPDDRTYFDREQRVWKTK